MIFIASLPVTGVESLPPLIYAIGSRVFPSLITADIRGLVEEVFWEKTLSENKVNIAINKTNNIRC